MRHSAIFPSRTANVKKNSASTSTPLCLPRPRWRVATTTWSPGSATIRWISISKPSHWFGQRPNASSTPSCPCCSGGTPGATISGACMIRMSSVHRARMASMSPRAYESKARRTSSTFCSDKRSDPSAVLDSRRLLEAVVAPEELVADGHGGDAGHAAVERLGRVLLEPLLDVVALDPGGDLVRVDARVSRRGKHVRDVRQRAALDEGLAEGGVPELALAAELVRDEGRPQRRKRPALNRPGVRRREGREAAVRRPGRDLLHDGRRVQVREPLVELAELVEQDGEGDRPPLGIRNELVETLRREVRIGRVEVVIEGRSWALGHSPQ